MTKRVLALGCGGSAGINFIESLRMADEDIYICGTDINRWHLELPDLDERYLVPPLSNPDYIEILNRLVEEHGITLVHAQPDVEVRNLSRNRDLIKGSIFLPDDAVIARCHDKLQFNTIMDQHDIPVPRAHPIGDEAALRRDLDDLVASSGKAWLRAIRGAGSRAALPVTNIDHALMWMDYWREKEGLGPEDFMVSEFLPGTEYAFQSLWRDGELICSAARERLEYIFGNLTPSGQSSSPSVARSVENDRVNEIATRAIEAVDPKPRGIYCVDIKENGDGVPCVIEINIGRFFTTSNFFARLGANMPYDYVRIAHGEEPVTFEPYNAVPEGWLWIRLMDKGPILVRDGDLGSIDMTK